MYQKMGLKECGCKLCAENNFTLLAESDRYGFDLKKQICNVCGLVQTYPSLGEEFLNKFYSYLYRPLYTKATGAVDYKILILEQREKGIRLVEYLKTKIQNPLPTYNLIEIGCSSGGIIAEAAPNFKSVQGCDLDVNGTAYARNYLGLNVETSAMPSALPEGPNIFLMSHVLEHLNNPLKQLENLRALMKPGDLLVIFVPGLNAVKTGDYKHDLRRYFHIAHLTDFSAGTLSEMAKLAGLDCMEIDERVNAIFRVGAISTDRIRKSKKDNLENILEIEASYKKNNYKLFKF